jgi:hypothetical protein
MSEDQNDKKLSKRYEHIALSEVASEKITSWIEQVSVKKKGVRITRKDFVNWLIEKSSENLSNGDLNSLIDRFYDEASFLRQLLREVKTAKKNGQTEPALEFIVRAKKTEQKKDEGATTQDENSERSFTALDKNDVE